MFKFWIFKGKNSRQLIMVAKDWKYYLSEKQEALNHTLWPIFSKMKKDGEMRPREGRILPAAQISVWIRLMVIEITRNVRLLSGECLLDGHGLSGDQSWRWKFDEKQIVPPASCYFDHHASKKFLLWLTSTWYPLYRKGYQSDIVFHFG